MKRLVNCCVSVVVSIPSSTEFIKLRAEMTDGTIVEGESNIPHSGKRIRHIYSDPSIAKARRGCITCH
ncbi:MAG: hypothetical protein ACLUPK_01670 [Veillonella sp.]